MLLKNWIEIDEDDYLNSVELSKTIKMKAKFFMIPAEITLFYWYEKCTNSCFLTAHLKWIECLCPTELTLSALSSCRQNVKDAFVWGPKYHKISKIVPFTLNLTNIQLYVVNWLAKKAPNIRLILSSLQN